MDVNADEYHELETVRLTTEKPITRKALHGFLKLRGYKREDDFYFLDRKDKAFAWQSISILTIDFIREGSETYNNSEATWNCLDLQYLLATLPVLIHSNLC